MASKKNRDLVDTFHLGLIERINSYLKEKRYRSVAFERDFRVYLEEKANDDYILVPVYAIVLHGDGALNTSAGDVSISALNVHELAFIMDQLEGGEYEVDEYDEDVETERMI